MLNTAASSDTTSAGLICSARPFEKALASGVYTVQCFGADGNLKWEEVFPNLVVNAGLQNMVAAYLAGATQTTTWYLGLVTGPAASTTYAATDTLASHAGWTEFTDYSGSRKAVTFGTPTTANPSVVSNSASPSTFTISGAGGTVAGAFLCSAASGTSGILFSAADFQSPGDRVVASGDILNVTYTFSLTAT